MIIPVMGNGFKLPKSKNPTVFTTHTTANNNKSCRESSSLSGHRRGLAGAHASLASSLLQQPLKVAEMAPRKGKTQKEEQVVLGPNVMEGENVFGVAHIFASFNDTFVHVTDLSGKVASVGDSNFAWHGLSSDRIEGSTSGNIAFFVTRQTVAAFMDMGVGHGGLVKFCRFLDMRPIASAIGCAPAIISTEGRPSAPESGEASSGGCDPSCPSCLTCRSCSSFSYVIGLCGWSTLDWLTVNIDISYTVIS
ncbi:hypothetical protein LSAT2_026873 [Lamellibrachia satsuma]|nr:hypothetical protein LSAT2_026873 [Lamellibrachia satsuma]